MLELKEGEYQMQGISLKEIAKKYSTPLYVYDSSVIQRQLKRLKDVFSAVNEIHIHYAAKSSTNLNLLKLMKSLGTGLDAVSIQEVKLGLMAGFLPEEILYTPNGVSMEEISQAVDLGVKLNIDNLSILEEFGHDFPNYPVCIRINPHIMAGGHQKISVGHLDSKFGISIHQLPHILRVVKNTKIKVEGLHMHTGSDILDVEVFLKGAEILFDAAPSFSDLDYLDFGSGFKVPYYNGDSETDIEFFGEMLSKKFNSYKAKHNKNLKLIFEPGKFLVSEAGLFLVSVNVIKQTTSTVFAGIDSGFNHLIRPMFYDSHHDIINISNPEGKFRYYTVVGYICETDTFASNRKINNIKENDILAFRNAGAYCFSMSSNYNSRYKPAEVLLHNGKDYLIRRRENLEDLLITTEQANFL